ncbi:probable serine/threonine-protein phosphatase 2a regulatory subunit b'' subunit ton2 [Phtheirospermum japonicum]|uniref:Probable serine/threonine-protein phosphatase 2a regulatory subunit b'' subunit ton2 n=1 Tax=Phtheirospermum japonicum TaxID=374723 RepID=A0A830BXW1_9LAMI|nr:probable serine/threonine-protein phosphatase 2a regulatory subunit b'' subunit ton2 [Phtheirospermum japonicum]
MIGSESRVKSFFKSTGCDFAGESLSEYEVYLMKCVVAAGQEHVLGEFGRGLDNREIEMGRSSIKNELYALAEMIEKWDANGGGRNEGFGNEEKETLRSLLKILGEVEEFYDCIGGIIGEENMSCKVMAVELNGYSIYFVKILVVSSRKRYRATTLSTPIWAVAENYHFEPAFVEGRKLMAEIEDVINIHVIIEGSMNSSNPYYLSSWRRDFSNDGSHEVEPRLSFVEGARDVAILDAMLESGKKQVKQQKSAEAGTIPSFYKKKPEEGSISHRVQRLAKYRFLELLNVDDLDAMWVCLRENCVIDDATGAEKMNCEDFCHIASSDNQERLAEAFLIVRLLRTAPYRTPQQGVLNLQK